MKNVLLVVLVSFVVAQNAQAYRGGMRCSDKSQVTESARKVLDYCLQAWRTFTQPTDPEPESCGTKLTAYENAFKEFRICVKKADEETRTQLRSNTPALMGED